MGIEIVLLVVVTLLTFGVIMGQNDDDRRR